MYFPLKTKHTRLDFACIGHLDCWQTSTDFANAVRKPELNKLSLDQVRQVFPYIPPRDIFRVNVKSKNGVEINGVYIETFIDPEKLDPRYIRTNINKVMIAVSHAKKMGAKIVALGGFTSIVLEGNLSSISTDETKFTTGNTLTSAFIINGIEKSAELHRINVRESNLLIVGATGDIGMACVNYFKTKANKLLLCARNVDRLEKLSKQLKNENIPVTTSVSSQELSKMADIIICAASSADIQLGEIKPNVVICDAGYPKNLDSKIKNQNEFIFHGGMGQVSCGYIFKPDYSDSLYQYPAPNIIHGCFLEAMILAFENRIENYSSGKGNITIDKMEAIYNLGLRHGIAIAPFYNKNGLLH